MITFDHLKLARRNLTELHRYRRFVLGAARGELAEIAIEHEHDNRSCRRAGRHLSSAEEDR